jgi:cytoskeletal protein RodZ
LSENDIHNADSSLSSPGSILKRCREYHGISLEEAAEATKVGENYLRALEEDQIREFANPAYLKGFLRIYATHLGLNPDDMIRLYERLYKPSPSRKNGRSDSAGDERPDQRRSFPWQKLALPTLLLLLMIITSVILNRSPAPPVPPTPPPSPRPAVVAVPPPAVQPVLSSVRPSPPAEKADEEATPEKSEGSEEPAPELNDSAKPPPEPGRGFILRMRVIQNGTLTVTIDGASSQNYDLASGDIIEWKADRTIALELSNAGGVDAELNGRPLKPFGPLDTPIYVVLDAQGVKQ